MSHVNLHQEHRLTLEEQEGLLTLIVVAVGSRGTVELEERGPVFP